MVRRWKPEEKLVKKFRKWLRRKEKPQESRSQAKKKNKYFKKDGLLISQPYKPRSKPRFVFLVAVCP